MLQTAPVFTSIQKYLTQDVKAGKNKFEITEAFETTLKIKKKDGEFFFSEI